MKSASLSLVSLSLVHSVRAASLQPVSPATGLSDEAIVTLIGVLAAVLGIGITLLVSTKTRSAVRRE
jgi:hypothetical protein